MIDTEIKGAPASIRAAGRWLEQELAQAVDDGVDGMNNARREAASEWLGDTGEAFCGALSRGTTQVEQVRRAAARTGSTFIDYAGSLETFQTRMAAIRSDAVAAGLTVTGQVIQDPGPGPARPSTTPSADAPPALITSYNALVSRYDDHQLLIDAYSDLAARASEVWAGVEQAWERVSAKDRSLDTVSWTFTLSDVAGGLGGAVAQVQSSALRGTSTYFKDLSDDYLARLAQQARNGTIPNAAQYYDDLRHYTNMGADAADDLSRATRLARLGKAAPVALGGVLAIGGAYYDYAHGGESAEQAILSNGGGFAASVATGVVIGTAIGGPVGTVVGAVVGTGVGVFTSGMVDGLFESGDVSEAAMAGLDTVVDTGEALVDVGGAIVDGVSGWFD